jgi:aminopeptidase N
VDGRHPLTARRRAVAVVLALGLAGCTGPTVTGHGVAGPASGPGTPTAAPASCPRSYVAPDPARPRMRLDFTIAPDHKTVHGDESVTFRPDLPVSQLVFRLTANTAPTVAEGNRIRIESATADHAAAHFTFSRANAAPSTQGGLLRIPFRTRLAAGTVVTAHIRFTLTLGSKSFDRFGRVGGYVWFGSGEPLLAWQRDYGWHTEAMADFPAESATSEAMDVHLTVHAPAADTVIMSGDPAVPPAVSHGMRTWTAHIGTARDVSVAAGPFRVADTTVGSTRLRIAASSVARARELVPEFQRAMRRLAAQFGPYPFPSLSVARLPARGGGIEYPSSILLLGSSRVVDVHETAHQWFYAMVGDSQAQHPWLDEAFATYAEALVDGRGSAAEPLLRLPGRVDRSTESYGHRMRAYYETTYYKGAAALLSARAAAGAAAWDAAMRCYVATNAWKIATPTDFEAAISKLPAAVRVLREAGAIP